jgi:hypothetical protein
MKGKVLTDFTALLREWGVPKPADRARVLVGRLEDLRIALVQPVHPDDPGAQPRAPGSGTPAPISYLTAREALGERRNRGE